MTITPTGSRGSIGRCNAFIEGGRPMGLRSDSVAGVRFLAAVHEGRGIKPAARSVGSIPGLRIGGCSRPFWFCVLADRPSDHSHTHRLVT